MTTDEQKFEMMLEALQNIEAAITAGLKAIQQEVREHYRALGPLVETIVEKG